MKRALLGAAVLGAGALTTAGVAAALPDDPVASARTAAAGARPGFQVPFACKLTVTAATFAEHRPQYSVDFQKAGISGTPVLAAAAGTVSRVADEGATSYGRWIEIDHGGGWTTRYAHLSSQAVKKGQQVALGKRIGTAGATGGVTGPHLHFEERLSGVVQKAVLGGVAVPYYGHTGFTSKNTCGGNPYTAAKVCGPGFSVIDAQAVAGGRVYLLYNAKTKVNCVTTLKSTNLGKATAASAHLQVKGGAKATDSGKFAYYAGPVKRTAAKKCVKWGGSVGSSSYTSPYEHCG
ncbi:M23 family metallopeptidase [Actinomadura parmotrematis]|uniref:M23 family metallopeptidase n=1 Tax=Actinomadura parmotrematis TaxID=2864039 RepID=A0ABS7FPE6_9ACTN|nr:M23 family metallopeptidase [Actinomadura parmotrematis]MBW8482252.1 M23 family metallopeptidase [Actinomadura parmotrematis]